MTKELRLVAIDSCIIVDFLTGADPTQQESARSTLEQHEQTYRVVLPAIVLPEIAGCGAVSSDVGGNDARKARVEKVQQWIQDSRYLVADLTERVARQAAQLASGYKLKGADASVLATAIAWNCAALYTRDKSLLKLDGQIPGLKIEVAARPLIEQETLSLVLSSGTDEAELGKVGSNGSS